MKKTMLVGPIGSGKTTLIQALSGGMPQYRKTQTVQYEDYFIDTPGEFLQNRGFYSALNVTSMEADVVAFICSATAGRIVFPPQFSGLFPKPVIGVITKIDLVENPACLEAIEDQLLTAGCESLFYVSSIDGTGLQQLKDFLACCEI